MNTHPPRRPPWLQPCPFASARRWPRRFLGVALLAWAAASAQAESFTVTNTAAMGPGSLHQAVADAWAHADAQSTITFDQPLDGQTITLTAFSNGLGCVTSNATTCSDGGTLSQQFGPSAFFITGGKTLTIDATVGLTQGVVLQRDSNAANFRLFDVNRGASLTLRGLTLSGGVARGGDSDFGGGALGAGGAIFNRGTLTVERGTFTGNTALGGYGGSAAFRVPRQPYSLGGGGGVGASGSPGNGGGPNGGNGGSSGSNGFGGGGGRGIDNDPNSTVGGPGGFGGGSGGGAGGGAAAGFGGGGGGCSGGGNGGGNGGCNNGGFGGGNGNAGSRGGDGGGGGGMGGALFNDAGTVTLSQVSFSGNDAQGGDSSTGFPGSGYGGALFNYTGQMALNFVTVAGNTVKAGGSQYRPAGSANGTGTGIYSLGDGRCNVGGNSCTGTSATLELNHSIVDAGSGTGGAQALVIHSINSGSSTSSGDTNLVASHSGFTGGIVSSTAPNLANLPTVLHGGMVDVRLPQTGSPAIDAGGACTGTDQRGVARPQGNACDIGAVELRPGSSYTLTASVTGPGSVTATPASPSGGITACGGTCSATYAGEATTSNIILTATPVSGQSLLAWGGDCSGTGVCIVNMGQHRNVTASFGFLVTVPVTLQVNDPAGGSVAHCATSAVQGSTYTCTPTLNAGYSVSFTGCTSVSGNTCTMANVQTAATIRVNYTLHTHPLSASVTGLVNNQLATIKNNGTAIGQPVGNGQPVTGSLIEGSNYALSAEAPHHNCTANGTASGTVSASVTVAFTCSPKAYSMSGSVTGLAGFLALVLNNEWAIAFSDGDFSIPNAMPYDHPYALTIAGVSDEQFCTISPNGSGTSATEDVTDVLVTCADKGTQAITCNAPTGKVYGNANFDYPTPSITTDPLGQTPGTLMFSLAPGSNACALDTDTSSQPPVSRLRITSAGSCTYLVNASATDTLNEAAQTCTIAVAKATPVITLTGDTGNLVIEQTRTLAASFTSQPVPAGAIIGFGSGNAAVCTVDSSGVVMAVAPGTCTIAAAWNGNANFNAASNTPLSFEVVLGATPVLTWHNPAPTTLTVDDTSDQPANSSVPGGTIRYDSSTPRICTVDVANGTVAALTRGDCTITASQAAHSPHPAALAISRTFSIVGIAQTLTFDAQQPATRRTVPGDTFAISPEASSSHADPARPIAYTSLPDGVCSVSGTTVTVLQLGPCTIAANQPGDERHEDAAQVTQSVLLTRQDTFSGTTVPASGTGGPGTASFTGGGDACSFDPTPGATAFVPAPATLPRGRALPQGLFQFKLLGCEEGSTVTMEVTWPEPLSTAAGDYLKHGFASPAERDSDTRSYFAPNGLVVSGHTATFSVTDGGLGDDDWTQDGTIADPSGPLQAAAVAPVPVPVPGLGPWALALLTLLAAALGLCRGRKIMR